METERNPEPEHTPEQLDRLGSTAFYEQYNAAMTQCLDAVTAGDGKAASESITTLMTLQAENPRSTYELQSRWRKTDADL